LKANGGGYWPELPPVEFYLDDSERSVISLKPSSQRIELTDRRLRFRLLRELLANPHRPKWLLPKILEREVIALLLGRRGSGKSFIALEWAMRVAAQGLPVLMISSEGAGLPNRVAAWLKRHNVNVEGDSLCVIEQRLNLCDTEAIDEIHATVDAWGKTPALIVIDTVSKNSGAL